MLYAEICVNTPLGAPRALGPGASLRGPSGDELVGQSFTYQVSASLTSRLQPGHLVWIPFRGRRLQGVVLRLSDAAPCFETREIISLVWAQPVLGSAQLALAHWISEQTLAPLIESLRLMLPAGLSQRGRTVFVRTSALAPSGLTEKQQALLARINQAPGDWSDITAGVLGTASPIKHVTQRDDLDPLIEMGLVNREVEFPSPPPRPKTDRQVQLLVDVETVAQTLPTLGHASKQADVLRWLAAQGPGPIPLLDLLAHVPCERSAVKALADRGWVTLTSVQSQSSPLGRAAALVSLSLAPDSVTDAIVELRGSAKHKAVLDFLLAHDGSAWIGRVYAETDATRLTLRDLETAGLVTVVEKMVWRDPLAGHEFESDSPLVLTPDQERVWDVVREMLRGDHSEPSSRPVLLHGVTGSGKTEIYLAAIAETLVQGRQAVVLVPEIALTPQTIRRFAARFPGKVTVWHSELGDGERFDVWRRVRTGHPAAQVVVGSRSALFLPFGQLGVIVVDEEHEPSYKQERTPRYHARAVAIELGRLCGAIVILGSATPLLETFYAAKRGEMTLLTLPRRIKAELPVVRIVDMRQELRVGNRSMFSRQLSEGLHRVLGAGQQAILYLNRRGTATFILCRDCGYVATCQRCASPLTFHGEGDLICHQCNRRYPSPLVCPKCASKRIRHFGAGTERVEEAVKLEFPTARTLRWDRDVTGTKGSHDAILARFVAHESDVLIGTQMIAKGLDLPLVTLVGVVAADVGLFLPDFRASERTFQLLTQVAGRAGRSELGGEVVVQTYHPDHYAILAASDHDYEGFYRQEMSFRRQQMYPPVRRVARLVYHHGQRAKAQAEAQRVADALRAEIASQSLPDTDLIGPAPCFYARQRGEWRWQIVMRSPDPVLPLRSFALGPGWRIDVDPVDLL
jgi:primosomal protein N' (replication factor Y)